MSSLPFLSNPNQLFYIVSVENPQYCLDCSQNPSALNKLIIYEINHGPNQKWRIVQDGQGNYGFINSQNQGSLQVPLQSHGKQGTQCLVGAPNGNINQKWQIVQSGHGYVIKLSPSPNVCLDIDGEYTFNNNHVIVWLYGPGKNNQLWKFIPA